MHIKRQETTIKLPIPRKGTKYVARALSHIKNSVPVVIAVRDMLKLAQTSAEVKRMIHQKLLKINGKLVKDSNESIKLFNLLEADKVYVLSLLPTGKYVFEEAKDKIVRLCKILNKTMVKKGNIQFNLHDGSNIISDSQFSIGDSIYLDLSGKIKKHLPIEKGRASIVIKGKYLGLKGNIESYDGDLVRINVNNKLVELDKNQVIIT